MKSFLRATMIVVALSAWSGTLVHVRAFDQRSTAPATPARQTASLFKDSRRVMAMAKVRGLGEVSALVAARPGAGDTVAREAVRLGGNVRYRADDIGYVRARLPLDRVAEFARFEGIEAVTLEIDELPAVPAAPGADPGRLQHPSGAPARTDWPPRITDGPLQEPYSPHRDLDAETLLAQHPTWDGRGVTVAVLDGHYDFLVPELQQAWTLDGRSVPKLVDAINATDPRDDGHENPQWVDMRTSATAASGRVAFQGKTFATPRDGAFRIGVFSERRFTDPANAAYIGRDIDRNGNPADDDGQFGVLWDEATNDVWVDLDRDLSFADERAMTDYRVRQDLGVFGTDKPETPVRESIGFTVQTDRANKFMSINVGLYQHSSMVVGALAASRKPHGRYDGVAPGSQVISIHYGVNTGHAMIEGLILAFADPRVDIVLLEQNSTVGNDYQLADGGNPLSILVNRMIEKHQKLMFAPGSNAPGLQLVDEPGLASRAVSVGGYQSRDSYQRNAGFSPAFDDNMHWGGLSHGPGGNGALKPDLLAPSGHLGNDPGYRMGSAVKGLYQLPPGYTMGGGTSQATPAAAGAAALLISAAKQAGVPYDPLRLKAALTGSARWIPRFPAHEQGSGLIQVGAAWSMLQALAKTPPTIQVNSRATVNTALGHLLTTTREGVGIFEREGWTTGQRGERAITLMRTSGPATPGAFALSWQGNDGTFSGPSSIALPLNTHVSVPIGIAVSSAGAHSAVLSVTHPSQPGFVHRVLNTIVAAEPFRAETGYTLRFEGTVPRPGDRAFFVQVPEGAPALKVDITSKDVGLRLSLLPPDRSQQRMAMGTAPGDLSLTVDRPMAGAWEINLWNGSDARTFDPDRPTPAPPTPVTVRAMLAGVIVDAVPSTGSDAGVPLALRASNRFASLPVALSSSALASGFAGPASLLAGEQRVMDIDVPAGSEAIWARVSRPAILADDVDLYLFDCTGSTCAAVMASTAASGDEWVTATNPRAGRWAVVIDALTVSGTRVDVQYADFVSNPRFGAVSVTDIPLERSAGSSWQSAGFAWMASRPPAPRQLFAVVPAVSPVARTIRGFSGPAVPIWLGVAELPLGQPQTGTIRR